MKQFLFVLSIYLLCSCSAAAQTNNDKGSSQSSVTTKGYYAIGSHAKKLQAATEIKTANSTAYPTAQKGYYNIGNNNKKIGKQLIVLHGAAPQQDNRGAWPAISKGYYSIGDNRRKLK